MDRTRMEMPGMGMPRMDMPSLESHQNPLPCSRHALGLRLRQELRTCWAGLRRIAQAKARRRKMKAMTGDRDWQMARRARTRLLIEYGGLIVKAGLGDLLKDDRATLLGGLLSLRDQIIGLDADQPETVKQRWKRRGLRVFDEDRAGAEKAGDRKEAESNSA